MITQSYIEKLTYNIIGACIEVHKIVGPGLLESVYQKCLEEELRIQNINFISELQIPIDYKVKIVHSDFRCDFLIADCIILEIKSVKDIDDIHKAQVLNYMNLLKVPKGILVNFNVTNIFHEGQKTFVNKYFQQLS